jgi:transcriptional regulator with PAS, ATPase and Fis domain
MRHPMGPRAAHFTLFDAGAFGLPLNKYGSSFAGANLLMPSRRPTRQLTQLLEQSPLPIYVLDDAREIVYCNPACAAWVGCEAKDLVGQTCVYHASESGTPLAEALAALCPPPQVFLGERASAHVVWKDQAGNLEQRAANFLPLGDSGRDGNSVVAILGEPQRSESPTTAESSDFESPALHERLQQLARQQRTKYRLDRLVGDSLVMRRVREQVRVAIESQSRVTIIGPQGSGREHIARTIHAGNANEVPGALLPVDCKALDPDLLPVSIKAFMRRAQVPDSKRLPTVLLLDVDALSLTSQSDLVGLTRLPYSTLRTICTACRSLSELTQAGSFSRELAYFLSPVVIELPALSERREDIPLIAQRFVEEFNFAGGKQLAGFSPAALDRLASLPWTGDVEELAAVVQEACHSVSTVWIGEADLPQRIRSVVAAGARPRRPAENFRLPEFLIDVERDLVERAMKRARGNKAKAARLLGISRTKLLRRLTQLGLDAPAEPEIDFKLVDDASESGAS